MSKDKLKNTFSTIKPYVEKLAIDSARGYMFGCVFGVFSSSRKQPLFKTMHESGKTFAKMSAAYSVTEMTMENIRCKDDFMNSATAGIVAGAVGSKKEKIPGSIILGAYSGISAYFQKLNGK